MSLKRKTVSEIETFPCLADIAVDEANRADARGGEIHRDRRAEPACANAQDARGLDLFLPGQPDFRMPFNFTAGSKDGGSRITVTREGAPARTFDSRDAVMALFGAPV